MASGSRSPHNARIAFDCKDTWQSCCSALAPGVALNGPSMRSMRRWATSPLPPSVRLLPPSGRSPRSSAARRHRARHSGHPSERAYAQALRCCNRLRRAAEIFSEAPPPRGHECRGSPRVRFQPLAARVGSREMARRPIASASAIARCDEQR
jgi:hypothetical protein